ncbi:hypothetical protein BJX76DRAFT_358514 [Aspergillus varians]
MRQRIEHLEVMVKRLVTPRQGISPSIISSSEGSRGEGAIRTPEMTRVGTTVIDAVHSVYKPTDDWYDVLREVNELKKVWIETLDEPADLQSTLSNSVDGTSLLFGQVDRVDVPEILSSLPPKAEVDKLIQWFFDRKTFTLSIPPIIHEPTFMQEYNDHWKDPSKTSVIWIGLLFSILGITMVAAQFGGPPEYEGVSEPKFHHYRQRTAQCLLMGDIAKCLPYTIETLRFNATAELNRKDDNSRGLWIMTGVIVRAAVNMGYHRDPDHTPYLSILKAEYRRRVWLSVKSMDEVASFLSGFPRMLPAINSDTKEPQNLYDWELCEETTALPLPRPLSEPTPATYLIAKGRLFHGLGEIIDFINGPCPDNYPRAIQIDQLLCNLWLNIPSLMKVDADQVERSSFRTPIDYSTLQLACMYHHGICTLHRKFTRKDGSDLPGHISRSRCLASSLALIDYQRLFQPSWYTSSRTRQMLVPAAIILLLELETRRRGPEVDSEIQADTILKAFESAVGLWKDASGSCDEAWKVYKTLNNMLRGLKTIDSTNPLPLLSANVWNGSPSEPSSALRMPDDNGIDWAWWDNLLDGSWPYDEQDLARGP